MQRFFAWFRKISQLRLYAALGAALMIWPVETVLSSVFFEVPNGLMTVEGNGASRLPFGYSIPVRYQQVFDASQFAPVPSGGAFLTRLSLRADCSNTFTWLVTNLQVNFSTTLKSPDNL